MTISIDPNQVIASYQQALAEQTHRAITAEVAPHAAQVRIGELETPLPEPEDAL